MTTGAVGSSNRRIVGLAAAILFSLAAAASAGDNAWTSSGPTTQFIGSLVPAPPGDPSLYAGAYGPVLYRLKDDHWKTVADGTGSPYPLVDAIAIGSSNPGEIYVGVSSGRETPPTLPTGGVYRSSDEGLTWVFGDVHEGDSVSIVVADPQNEGTVYAVATACICQPIYCYDFGPYCPGRIYKSVDSGATWKRLGSLDGVEALVAAPSALYAVAQRTMFKSSDGGNSWTAINSGLPLQSGPSSGLAISLADPNVLYVTTTGSPDQRIAVFKTTDGGSIWRPTALTFYQVGNTTSIAVDPTNEDVVYVTADVENVPGGAGLFRTTDGGESWTHFDAGLPDRRIQQVAIDRDGGTIHVSIYPRGVFDYTYSPPLRSRPRKSPPGRTLPWR